MDPYWASRSGTTTGLPRLRGDGPQAIDSLRDELRAPPPTRGWTPGHRFAARRAAGSPAYAGMDPRRNSRTSRCIWLPRLRGDGPCGVVVARRQPQAPPPTRGWTPHISALPRTTRGSPAYAGMDRSAKRIDMDRAGLPRLRGDGPVRTDRPPDRPPAPPPTRGWTRSWRRRQHRTGGSPAYAGMDPIPSGSGMGSLGLPRLRGDGPSTGPLSMKPMKAPPPTRGWTPRTCSTMLSVRGSPAYAGMDPGEKGDLGKKGRLPRLRGDGPGTRRRTRRTTGAPPPTRGWTRRPDPRPEARQGSPAYAGMDPPCCWTRPPPCWLPRLRGDGPSTSASIRVVIPAPPPTRGWTRLLSTPSHQLLGSPAYAGMDRPAAEGRGRSGGSSISRCTSGNSASAACIPCRSRRPGRSGRCPAA